MTFEIVAVRASPAYPSSNQLGIYAAVHVRRADVAACIAAPQSLVVGALKAQNRGVQVVHVHAVLDGFETKVVGCPVGLPDRSLVNK